VKELEMQGAINELAGQGVMLRDRAVNHAADLAVARAKIAELEAKLKELESKPKPKPNTAPKK